MIRFLIDQFRNAPGPLKKPRILIADLAEEVLDLAGHYLKKDNCDDGYPCCSSSPVPAPLTRQSPETASKPVVAPEPAAEPIPTPVTAEASSAGEAIDPRLTAAIANPRNLRKQEFKVLAILWDAYSKKRGALSAKAISELGEETVKISIRHENVRKVIRMRLENYVKVHAQGVGSGTVYNYELSDEGAEYFTSTYLNQN